MTHPDLGPLLIDHPVHVDHRRRHRRDSALEDRPIEPDACDPRLVEALKRADRGVQDLIPPRILMLALPCFDIEIAPLRTTARTVSTSSLRSAS